jgi:hypothetical protein
MKRTFAHCTVGGAAAAALLLGLAGCGGPTHGTPDAAPAVVDASAASGPDAAPVDRAPDLRALDAAPPVGRDASTKPDAVISTGPDAAPMPSADAGPAVDAAAAPAVGGPELEAACTLASATFVNQDPTSEGGQRFAMTIPDPEAFMKARAHQDCLILYDQAANVKRTTAITLTIESPGDGVAATGGNQVGFSATYIAGYNGNIAGEINGVIAHEFTHVYQYNRGPGWLIEGMADYVRFKAGFFTLAQRRKGGNFDDAYRTTGFFLAWLDDQYPNFARKLNQAMKTGASEATFETLTGLPIQALWDEYQAAIP